MVSQLGSVVPMKTARPGSPPARLDASGNRTPRGPSAWSANGGRHRLHLRNQHVRLYRQQRRDPRIDGVFIESRAVQHGLDPSGKRITPLGEARHLAQIAVVDCGAGVLDIRG